MAVNAINIPGMKKAEAVKGSCLKSCVCYSFGTISPTPFKDNVTYCM